MKTCPRVSSREIHTLRVAQMFPHCTVSKETSDPSPALGHPGNANSVSYSQPEVSEESL